MYERGAIRTLGLRDDHGPSHPETTMNIRLLLAGAALLAAAACSSHPAAPDERRPALRRTDGAAGDSVNGTIFSVGDGAGGQLGSGNDGGAVVSATPAAPAPPTHQR